MFLDDLPMLQDEDDLAMDEMDSSRDEGDLPPFAELVRQREERQRQQQQSIQEASGLISPAVQHEAQPALIAPLVQQQQQQVQQHSLIAPNAQQQAQMAQMAQAPVAQQPQPQRQQPQMAQQQQQAAPAAPAAPGQIRLAQAPPAHVIGAQIQAREQQAANLPQLQAQRQGYIQVGAPDWTALGGKSIFLRAGNRGGGFVIS